MTPRGERVAWEQVDGVLLLDKPRGSTSNAALQRARRLYRAEKAGHAGTLDPLATGLLPCLFGEATKFGAELLGADKTYEATIALGITTTTGDEEGEVIERSPAAVEQTDVERVLARFRGPVAQVPPMYSAIKRAGRPLYSYARAGEVVHRVARTVTIHELTLERFSPDRLAVRVRCGKGTYVRVLAEDIGRALGCGGCLAALRRSAVGTLSAADAVSVEALEALSAGARAGRLRRVDSLVEHLPALTVQDGLATRFRCGQAVPGSSVERGRFRVYAADGAFIGVGEIDGAGELRPQRLLRQDERATGPSGAAARIL